MAKIGLEMHIQLLSPTKLFSPVSRGRIEAFDVALPGSLPVISPTPLRLALLSSLLLSCHIPPYSSFDRKHYFYSDQPAGYQITQQYHPLALKGRVGDVRIARVQLEQDTAKTLHDHERRSSFVNMGRAGAALIEVVTEPDISSAQQAIDFVRTVQKLFRRFKVGEMSMETGSLRCDVNVSTPNSCRVELKNLNGLTSLGAAIEAEVARQKEVVARGDTVKRETRFFDPFAGTTFPLREKETSVDYRYMPEPDLPVIHVPKDLVDRLKREIDTTPPYVEETEGAATLIKTYGIAKRDADILVAGGSATVEWYESAVGEHVEFAQLLANWMINDLFRELKKSGGSLEDIEPEEWKEVIGAVWRGEFKRSDVEPYLAEFLRQRRDSASTTAKTLLEHVREQASRPMDNERVDVYGLLQREKSTVEKWQKSSEDPKKSEAAVGWLVGRAVKDAKEKGWKVEAKALRERILQALKGSRNLN